MVLPSLQWRAVVGGSPLEEVSCLCCPNGIQTDLLRINGLVVVANSSDKPTRQVFSGKDTLKYPVLVLIHVLHFINKDKGNRL